ncbi:DUF397 domain-containing protein [Streptomyces albireticuli]|uniref:DUF397 domain-containing protein n=1 Tax=Streptomyces albireticuli TaxID=1940 RepID=A0A2A2D122_9ACTN|nr:DUF397 domain-containing protein [Streptomyces albireticuli]MCD9143920.1 DUF397 domain-containing protein [Streptomyces albireticuli]MCD9161649.1 DUF397 domain-containing protein [Streptomyces albireticuli]MCD9192037.1 DUF397 domain-containing protein [Streptomyces albireticuli]PAU45040.1 DUF397 domain-containing protein [Streptomyces albireticuli]
MSHVAWQKSTYSADTAGNECVEVGFAHGTLALRESDEPGVVITTTPGSLRTLIRLLKVRGAGVG